MENAKMVVLNNKQNSSFKAVLNLKLDSPSIIKFYNFQNPNKRLALGVKQGKNVVKVPLNLNQNNCEFSLPKTVDINQNLFCAVVDVTNAFCPEIMLSGSLNTDDCNTTIESAFVTTKPEDNSVLYEEEPIEKIEEIIDKNLQEDATSNYYDNCSNCRYRQAFYAGGKCCKDISSTSNKPQNSPNIAQNNNISNSIINNLMQDNGQNSSQFIYDEQQNINKKYENKFVEINNKNSKNIQDQPNQNISNLTQNNLYNNALMEQNSNTNFNNNFDEIETNYTQNKCYNSNINSLQNSYQNVTSKEKTINSFNNNFSANSNNNLNLNNSNLNPNFNNDYAYVVQEENAKINAKNSEQNNFTLNEEESQTDNTSTFEPQTFYEQIKPQLDNLFNKYETEETLQQLIANSKWVRVNYDNSENYYVLGLIYDDNFENVEFISYGMPSNDSINAPEDIKDYAQWLELENSQTGTKGYWIVYQNALTGETIKISFV